ncbi:putative bifunctional diguanylate cyclase/phosphodiesterase [Hartmannibacter diazotrophicus]|nr:EAL domain-containing protein [Hartmannibacter diazotrophicus]
MTSLIRRWRRVSGCIRACLTPAALRKELRLAEEAAKKARDQLHDAISVLPEGIVFLDDEGRYILWNARYEEIYSRSADLFEVGARLEDTLRVGIARGDYPLAVGREEEWLSERLALMANPGKSHEQLLADGRWIMIQERRTSGGGTIGLRVDITAMKRREASFRLLFEGNPVPMMLVDPETLRICEVNEAACRHYGHRQDSFAGRSLTDLHHPDHHGDLKLDNYTETLNAFDRTWRQFKADGSQIDVTAFASHLDFEDNERILLAFIDVTERRRSEERLAHMARHDLLTGLPNRLAFNEQIATGMAEARKRGHGAAALLIDLDSFKAVNDTFGHSVGDALLKEAARRIREALDDTCVPARLGGDEFAVFVPLGADDQRDEPIARAIIRSLCEPFQINMQHVAVGASIGIARMTDDSSDPEQLLRHADIALYKAKADGRGSFRHFEPGMDAQMLERQRLELDLRMAVEKGEFSVHYQPLVNLEDQKVSGFEALLRWSHPVRGNIPPADFIPLAEETGLIDAIGRFVLEQACRDAVTWPDHMKVAVNLSPAQFRTTEVLATVVRALDLSGLRPARLDLEITESLLMDRSDGALQTLKALRELGVGISMDDFGTGYSSLSYLRSFPFTKIKIDKSFVKDLHASADSQAIVRAIVGLGRSMGMKVIAEGIENADDLDFLMQEGCAEGQGYLFSKPRPVSEMAELLESSPAQTSVQS